MPFRPNYGLGKAIAVLREARNLSQKELAERVGSDASYISLIETGRRNPRDPTRRRIAEGLNVPEYLLWLLASDPSAFRTMPNDQREALARMLLDVYIEGTTSTGSEV